MIEEQKVLMTVVKSDASSTGMATYILHDRGQKIAFSQFFPERKKKSSTWREFKAIEYSLESLKMFLTQQKVLWKTDNFGVSRIVNKGSPINELQKMAENIYDFCRSENIFLKIIWEPRENFELANELSKAIDHDDWQTKREFFNQLDNMWGPFTVDRFADSHNAKTKRFYSKYFCPNTKGVNSLNYCWKKRVRKKRL